MPTKHRLQGRPPAFSYRDVKHKDIAGPSPGFELHCDQTRLACLAERFGTPLYVYSASTIRERIRVFERAFRKVPHTVCYSVKANSNLSILRLLARTGCGLDVVSGGELGECCASAEAPRKKPSSRGSA